MTSTPRVPLERVLALLRPSPFATPPPRTLLQIQTQFIANPNLRSHRSLFSLFIISTCRSLGPHHAALLLSHLPPEPSLPLWNLLFKTTAESHHGLLFLAFFRTMLWRGIRPGAAIFSILLRSCVTSPDDHPGEALHCHILKSGLASSVIIATGLLDYYGKIGRLELALKVFVEMPEPDVIAGNAMLAAMSSHSRVADARELFDGMLERSAASWNTMITCYCRCGDVDSAREVFDANPCKDVVSWNAMIDGYCKVGMMDMARNLFEQMGCTRNAVTWNTVITAYVHQREFENAISLFRRMQLENARPTEVTMVSLLSACAHLGALELGRWIHAYICNHRLKIDVILGNALIDMYCKCGIIGAAREVFHSMPVKNVFCWNSIIAGFGMHGHGREAIESFHEMEKENKIRPDEITFVGVLSACSHAGLISEGKNYFLLMRNDYGIEPKMEHYGCMVDLLGRAGLLQEALDLIRKMAIKPNFVIWGSLLRACRVHKDNISSEEVTRHLLELDPDDGGNYVFLSNVYASLRRWNDVEKCRNAMLEKGVRKTPGCSSIEVNNIVYEFVAGGISHPQTEKINALLDEIDLELRKMGYEPDRISVLHDIEEEEKEIAVKYHSEKIAVAFGLMSIPEGRLIRIVKNLRVCSDCHEALKLVSMLFGREIIVRDRKRFHHFNNGLCSCNDYW